MAKRKVTPQIVRGNASILSFFTPKTFPSSSLPLTDTHPQEGVKTNSSVSASATAKDEEKSDGATNKEEMLAQQTVCTLNCILATNALLIFHLRYHLDASLT